MLRAGFLTDIIQHSNLEIIRIEVIPSGEP